MKNSGWIKIHRCLMDKAFSKDPEKLSLWVHLLMLANHTEREEMFGGKPIKCKPGQFTIGRNQLADLTGIDRNKIERTLTYFEKIEQQIEQQTSNKNRLITIKNWHLYQVQENSEQQNEQQVSNNRATSEHTKRTKELKNIRSTSAHAREEDQGEQNWKFIEENWTTSEAFTHDLKEDWLKIPLSEQNNIVELVRLNPKFFNPTRFWKRNFLKEAGGNYQWLYNKVETEAAKQASGDFNKISLDELYKDL